MVILAVVLSTIPLLVNPWAELPYEPIKISVIEMAAASCAAAFVFTLLRDKWRVIQDIFASYYWLDLAVVVWFIVLALSTVVSVSPFMSFFGSDERETGLLYYSALTLLYLFIRTGFKPQHWATLVRLSCLAAFLVSAYGIVQWLGYDLSRLAHAFPLYGRTGPTRAFATLGHPNFLGAYLAMIAPLGLYVCVNDRRRIWCVFGWLAVGTSAVATALTYSRGAWVAYIGGLAVTVLLWRQKAAVWYWWAGVAGSSLLLIGLLSLFWLRPVLLGSQNSFLYRTGSALDVTQGSTLARLAEWGYALHWLPQRPVLGYGLDTYVQYSIQRQKNPMERNRDWSQPDPSVADRLHSQPLDIAWATGLLGLSAFTLLLGVVFQRLKKMFKQNTDNRQWLAAITGCLAAYLVGNLSGFDFSVSGLWFYLVLAAVASATDSAGRDSLASGSGNG